VSAEVHQIRTEPSVRVPGAGRPFAHRRRRRPAGQALAEFVLIAPIVLVLLLVVGDFARLFATSISVESAARDAAEVAAQEYLRNPPSASPPATYYDGTTGTSIHEVAANTVCHELGDLPNAGSNCASIPVLTCVHDGLDPGCTTLYPAGVWVPPQCGSLTSSLPNNAQGGGTETSAWVEVRICYRFSTLLNIAQIGPIPLPFGDFYIQRDRAFTVANY
jgi:TadE-like protein